MTLARRTVLTAGLGAGWLALGGCMPFRGRTVEVTSGVGPERTEAWTLLAEQAVRRVEDLWGAGAVSRPVRLVLPADVRGFSRASGHDAGRSDVPAVTVGRGSGAQVVVHPDAWERLNPEGRQAVLTHEVTHLAMQGDGPVPGWLGEGLAEYTAHRASSTPASAIAGSALDGVRAGELPDGWPDPLAGAADSRWDRYALSWLACRYLAESWSEADLMALYHRVAGGCDPARAVRQVLEVAESDVLAGWRRWLARLAGQPATSP